MFSLGIRLKSVVVGTFLLLGSTLALQDVADARAGRGRSSGMSRGSTYRSAPSQQPQNYNNQGYAPQSGYKNQPYQQPSSPRGSMWRGIAGGLAGGLIGSMIFGSLANGSGFGPGSGSGIGLFEVLLIGGAAYFGYRWWRRRQLAAVYAGSNPGLHSRGYDSHQASYTGKSQSTLPHNKDVAVQDYGYSTPLDSYSSKPQGYAPQSVPTTISPLHESEARSIFLQVQRAWSQQDLRSAQPVMTEVMMGVLGSDLHDMQRQGQINTLDQIQIHLSTIVAQNFEGFPPSTSVRFVAEAIDLTRDARTGAIIEGQTHRPQQFIEVWNFSFENGSWKLAGIEQEPH